MAESAGSKRQGAQNDSAENEAINRMLDDWQHLPGHVFGGVLIIDNRIMAFALGERPRCNTLSPFILKRRLMHIAAPMRPSTALCWKTSAAITVLSTGNRIWG